MYSVMHSVMVTTSPRTATARSCDMYCRSRMMLPCDVWCAPLSWNNNNNNNNDDGLGAAEEEEEEDDGEAADLLRADNDSDAAAAAAATATPSSSSSSSMSSSSCNRCWLGVFEVVVVIGCSC